MVSGGPECAVMGEATYAVVAFARDPNPCTVGRLGIYKPPTRVGHLKRSEWTLWVRSQFRSLAIPFCWCWLTIFLGIPKCSHSGPQQAGELQPYWYGKSFEGMGYPKSWFRIMARNSRQGAWPPYVRSGASLSGSWPHTNRKRILWSGPIAT